MEADNEASSSTLSEIAQITDDISGIQRVDSASNLSTFCQTQQLIRQLQQNKSSFRWPLPRCSGVVNDLKQELCDESLHEMADIARTSDIIEPSNSRSSFEEAEVLFEETQK